jgi:Flp pilus assembly protein TadG
MRKPDANIYRSQMENFFSSSALGKLRDQGQALVEFTLIFILLVALSWIPAEFGLAFYTGQMALNASREGARLAAASKTLNTAEITTATCKRLSSAILRDATPNCAPDSNANVAVVQDLASPGCPITVTVRGDYNFRFFQMLRMLTPSGTIPDKVTITRTTKMQSEWPTACP